MTDNQNTLSSQSIQDAFYASFAQSYNRNVIKGRLAHELINIPSVKEEISNIISDAFVEYFFEKFSLPAGDKDAIQELEQETAKSLFINIEDEIIEAYNKHASDSVDLLIEECLQAV